MIIACHKDYQILVRSLQLISINPTTLYAGDPAFVLTATGTGFTPACTVQWNGAGRVTAFIDPNHLTANILAADIAAAGNYNVTVTDGTNTTTPIVFSAIVFVPPATVRIVEYAALNACWALYDGDHLSSDIVPFVGGIPQQYAEAADFGGTFFLFLIAFRQVRGLDSLLNIIFRFTKNDLFQSPYGTYIWVSGSPFFAGMGQITIAP